MSKRKVVAAVVSQQQSAAGFVMDNLILDGGGHSNDISYSPDGTKMAGSTDVGGVRYHDGAWRYTTTTGATDDRFVAASVVMNSGVILSLVGDNATGKLIEISADGTATDLVQNLFVSANGFSTGDVGARPRPVGQTIVYDATNNLVYCCTEEGVYRYNRGNPSDPNNGFIALVGISCRGFGHNNDGHQPDVDRLFVSTRTVGLVELIGVQGTTVAMRVSDQAFSRFEDAALMTATSALCCGHESGVYRYDGTGGVTVNGAQQQTGPTTSLELTTYSMTAEVTMPNWATNTGGLIEKWDTTSSTLQQHRFDLQGLGVLRYRQRLTGGGALGTYDSIAAVTLTGRGFVQFRRAGTVGSFWQSTDGVAWTQVGSNVAMSATVPQAEATIAWSAGGSADGNGPLPSGAIIHRAWVTTTSPQPFVSLNLTGLVAGATSYTSVTAGAWTLAGTVTAGGVDATPSQAVNPAANGANIRWTSAACITNGANVLGAVGVFNVDSGSEWIYRALSAATVTTAGWDVGTPNVTTLHPGTSHFSPANRVLGEDQVGSTNIAGVSCLAFNPANVNQLAASATFAIFRCSNFAGTAASIAWETFCEGNSVVSLPSAFIDADGNVLIAAVDHDTLVVAAANLLTTEPDRVNIPVGPNGWDVCAVGSGANKVSVAAATNDISSTDGDVRYHRGSGVPTAWTTSGYDAATNGRPGGVFGWDDGAGIYKFVIWADTVGFRWATFTLATDTWSAWTTMVTGPTTGLTTSNANQRRTVTGNSTGSVLIAIQLTDGKIWRSLNEGVNWTNIATGIASSQVTRKGFLAYYPAGDWAVVTDSDGIYRISAVSGAATLTTISTTTDAGPVAIDSSGRAYVHMHGAGPSPLYRFSSFATASTVADAVDIAGDGYATRCPDLASMITIGTVNGVERGVTTYQGAGVCTWTIPA